MENDCIRQLMAISGAKRRSACSPSLRGAENVLQLCIFEDIVKSPEYHLGTWGLRADDPYCDRV
jgi:hypothetical protein